MRGRSRQSLVLRGGKLAPLASRGVTAGLNIEIGQTIF